MSQTGIAELVARQRAFFRSGRTRDLGFRRDRLRALRDMVVSAEPRIFEALRADLGRPPYEAYGGDVAPLRNEIVHALRHVASWARPRRVRTILLHQPARSEVRPEPYGVVLVMSPWNYPLQLALIPAVGALAAGNCAILKPSPLAHETSALLAELVGRTFDPGHLTVVQGGIEPAEALLAERLDHVFFTGSPEVGRRVMTAAARHLTPVTLELGGKSPCVVDADVDLDVTARRIAWAKFVNAGQTCVAVDYVLADRRVKGALLDRLAAVIREFYGDDPRRSPDLGRIVDDRHHERLTGYLRRGRIVVGGESSREERYLAPTVLDGVGPGDPVMEEEIFGPILPVLEYGEIGEAIAFVTERPPPLSLSVFSRDERLVARVLGEVRAGSACVNDAMFQVMSHHLLFGGVGESGMGAYHGKASFDAFSRRLAVLRRPFALDFRLRYPPYAGKLGWLRRIF